METIENVLILTNDAKERQLIKQYVKHGMSPKEAYVKANDFLLNRPNIDEQMAEIQKQKRIDMLKDNKDLVEGLDDEDLEFLEIEKNTGDDEFDDTVKDGMTKDEVEAYNRMRDAEKSFEKDGSGELNPNSERKKMNVWNDKFIEVKE